MYGKLFEQMYDGTLGTRGPWEALVTFQQMIVLADQKGNVDMTAEALARRTTIPLEIIRKGLIELELPDPDSRSPDEEGRRIVRLSEGRDWGWRIVNYEHYRKLRSAEERRAYMAQYQRNRRASQRDEAPATRGISEVNNASTDVNTVNSSEQCQPIAVSSKQEAVSSKSQTLLSGKPDEMRLSKQKRKAEALQLLHFLNEKAGKHFREVPANLKLIEARLGESTLQELKTMTAKKCREWMGTEQEIYLRPETLYNATKCNSYLGSITPEESCNVPAATVLSNLAQRNANADGPLPTEPEVNPQT